MQTFSSAFQAELDKGPTEPHVLVDLLEFYDSEYVPGAGGPDPADALELFAGQDITWDGNTYRREVISRGDIVRNMGEKTNSVSIVFSGISRYLATLAENQAIEGMILVIRTVAPSVTDDSAVIFVGRCDKPGDIDKKQFSLSARQDFGNINQTAPPREFSNVDPEGRLPSDPLFEGINFVAVGGTLTYGGSPGRSGSIIGAILGGVVGFLFGRRSSVPATTKQWSSIDGTPYGQKIREVFGRVQLQLRPFAWADKGLFVSYLMEACAGPILAIENIRTRTEGFVNPAGENIPYNLPGPIGPVVHLGDPGGTGTNTGNANQADLGGGIYFSRLAYIEGASNGSTQDATDDPPVVTALVFGRIIPLPDSSGAYVVTGWTDNPVHIARFILTDSKFVNIDSGFMEDDVNYLTALQCDTPLFDDTNDEMIPIHQDDYPDAGVTFTRYRSTGLLNPRTALYRDLGDTSILPEGVDGPYEPWDPTDPIPPQIPGATPTFTRQKLLRKRYTCNFPLVEEIRAVDLLYKIVFPTFKGYLRVNKYGRYEIRSEVPADSTRIRSSLSVGATSIPVLDVTPWKTNELLAGRILLGVGILTSEVRTVTSADYSTSGNSISLSAGAGGGGVVATASGASLSGGSTSAQASGTITFSGTPVAGNTVTITIDGIAVVYTLGSEDTTSTVAIMVKDYINATPKLQGYIRASWDSGSPTVVTIKALHGALNVPALLKTHSGPVVNPSAAPTVAAAASGSLAAGIYYLAYSDVAGGGQTALTPIANVTLTAGQKISVTSLPAFPAGVAERHFYLSEETGSENLRYVVSRVNTSNFVIDDLPEPGAAMPPSSNTTAEELIRVAMSFATNSQDIYPAWPRSTVVVLNDVYLPTVLNGHKYQATSITTGITAATEPTWPTSAGGTVVDGGVTWTEIGATVLSQAGLTRSNVLKDSFHFPLGSRQSSVNQIKGQFRSAKDDFALQPFKVNDKAHQLQVKKQLPLEMDLSAVDNWHQTFRLANGALSKFREGDWFNTFGTGPQGLCLEEGDVICASDDAGGLINAVTRIEELRITKDHHVIVTQARKYSTNMFSDDVGSHQVVIPSTLKLSRPRAVSDVLVSQDGLGNWLISFTGNPRTIEEPATYTVLIGATSDWSDPEANTVRALPVTRATTHAGLLFSNGSGGDLQVGDDYLITPHADGNNLYSPFVFGAGDSSLAIGLDQITKTYQKIDFTMQWLSFDREMDNGDFAADFLIARVGLQPIGDIPEDPDDLPTTIDWDLCPIMIEWSAGTKPYTVKETYKSFGVAVADQVLRDNVDPGMKDDAATLKRKGPRHSFQLSGTEYRAYTGYSPGAGQKPDAIVTAPSGGFPFPLRLVVEVIGSSSRIGVEDIMVGGDFLVTIYSVRDQEEDGGLIDPIYGQIYQNSRFASIPNGHTVEFEAP